MVAKFGNDWELEWKNKFPSSLPNYGKIIYKIILHISNPSVFLPQFGNCGSTRAWGGKGGTAVPPGGFRGEARFPPLAQAVLPDTPGYKPHLAQKEKHNYSDPNRKYYLACIIQTAYYIYMLPH